LLALTRLCDLLLWPEQNVRTIELGRHVMETWYFSPFPKEYYPLGFIDRVRLCCLKAAELCSRLAYQANL